MLQSLHPRASTNNAAAAAAAASSSSSSSSSMRAKRADHSTSIGDVEIGADEEPPQLPNKRPHHHAPGDPSPSDSSTAASSSALRLLGLLLQCAEAVATDRLREALDMLPELSELASPFGSSPERVAAYFADALRARLVGSFLGAYTPIHSSPNALPRALSLALASSAAKAFQALNSLSPLVKFSHFTANQAIFHAIRAAPRVHIVDLDIMQGLQWPGLFHILASRPEGKPLSVRLTGVGSSLELLEATGRRLADFAAALGLPFQFRPFEGKIGHVAHPAELLGGRAYDDDGPDHGDDNDEVTVVHWTHHCLYDVTGSDLGAIHLLRTIRPKLITIVEQDLGTGADSSGGFLRRFVEALHYYSALFDALGDNCIATSDPRGPGDSVDLTELERHVVERQVLGCEIRNIVAVGGPKRTGEVRVERWGDELQRAGFQRVSLAGSPAAQAGLLLGMYPWKGYTLVEEGGCLKLGWKDLSLLTASAWEPTPDLQHGSRDGCVTDVDHSF